MITQEQKKFREGKLGASSAAAALGLNPWKTRARLAAELLGKVKSKPIKGTSNRIGNKIEKLIREEFFELTGIEVREVDSAAAATYKFPKYKVWAKESPDGKELVSILSNKFDWMICHADAITWDYDPVHIVEIKSVGPNQVKHWGPSLKKDGVPAYVVAQCCMQCYMTGINNCIVLAYFGGGDLRYYFLTFDAETYEFLLEGLCDFWSYVEEGKFPPAHVQDNSLLNCIYGSPAEAPLEIGKSSLINDMAAAAIKKLGKVKADIKVLEEEKSRCEVFLKDLMKDKYNAITIGGIEKVTWKETTSREAGVVDWESVAQELASYRPTEFSQEVAWKNKVKEIMLKHTTHPTTRRFNLPKLKKNKDK